MQIPLDVAYRGVAKTDALEDLIVAQTDKLDQVCDHIDAIHVVVEKPNESVKTGSGYRVSIDVTIPPGHVINARHEVQDGEPGQGPDTAVRDAFHHARRQITELNDKQKGHVKTHDESKDLPATVTKLFPDYGFAETPEGREIYFHRNAVIEGDFDKLAEGVAVAYAEEEGVEGPQARHVRPIAGPEEPPRSVTPAQSEPPSSA
ncbi:MAG: cold shock domain-containing protein [Phycisphaeraceae bacterium]